ncbi:MAG: hypothetical protein KF800_19550 [Lysobacter sp.]|nr:hypothetical protein [Lysobacter sp.]
MGKSLWSLSMLAVPLLLVAGNAAAMETYAGVIELQDGEATFRGCARGAKAYPLRDAERVKAVAQLRARPVPQGFWYGEVTGEIDHGAGGEVMTVLAITGLRPGMGCEMAEAGRGHANPSMMAGRPAAQRSPRTADSARLGDDDGGGDPAAIGDE